MKLKLYILSITSLFCFQVFATSPAFIDCTSVDGITILANESMVVLGNEILSKNSPKKSHTVSADQLVYDSWQYSVTAYKQFCSSGGYQGLMITIKDTGVTSNYKCNKRIICD